MAALPHRRNGMANRKKSPSKRPKKATPRVAASKKEEVLRPDTKVERFRQNMRVELTDQDILERSRRVSRALSEKALRVEAAKSATAHLKAEIKQIDSEISRLSQEVNDGACFKEVECERRFLYRVGKVIEVRTDTDVITYERAMSGSERQPELPGLAHPQSDAADIDFLGGEDEPTGDVPA